MEPLAIFKLLPLRDWGYIAAAIAIATLAGLFIHHERSIGAAESKAQLEHERAEVAIVGAKAASAALSEGQRREDALKEIIHANQEVIARQAAAAAANIADRRDFGVQLDAYVRGHARPADPASPASGPAAGDPLVVLAGLLDRLDQRASDLAKLADDRGAAGAACERSYDSLKAKP